MDGFEYKMEPEYESGGRVIFDLEIDETSGGKEGYYMAVTGEINEQDGYPVVEFDEINIEKYNEKNDEWEAVPAIEINEDELTQIVISRIW
jgi:hypothetical protein